MVPGATYEEQMALKRARDWLRLNPPGSPEWNKVADRPAPPPPQYPIQPLGGELPPSNPDQPPVYPSQPLDAAQPQGVPTMDETEDSPAPEAGLDALAFANMTPQTIFRSMADLQGKIAKLSPAMGQTDYEAARQKIAERRYGPSRAEQLFALSAALAKPTYAGNRFGQIIGNVAPALADTERARREATEARETALEQLKQQYLTGQNATERQKLEAQLGLVKTAAQMAKPAAGLSYDAQRGVFVDKNNPRPTSNVYYDPKAGVRLVQWQDGYWRKDNPDGTVSVFERYGDEFRPLTGGAR